MLANKKDLDPTSDPQKFADAAVDFINSEFDMQESFVEAAFSVMRTEVSDRVLAKWTFEKSKFFEFCPVEAQAFMAMYSFVVVESQRGIIEYDMKCEFMNSARALYKKLTDSELDTLVKDRILAATSAGIYVSFH